VNPHQDWCSLVEVELGIDSSTFSKGLLDAVRFGGKLHKINYHGLEEIAVSPFIYCNIGKSPFAFKGLSVGSDIIVPLYNGDDVSCSLIGKIEHNKGDFLENIVKKEVFVNL
jgi:hypothetical protein